MPVEYHGESESFAFAQVAEKISRNTREALSGCREEKVLPREAAVELAVERVKAAMHDRQRG